MVNTKRTLNLQNPSFWYLVGLITSDGCLSNDGRHIDITSKDEHFLSGLRDELRLSSRVCKKYNSQHQQAFHIQISNKTFYDFLLSVGLKPKKSLTIETLNIPDRFFADFLRGLIGGDGCIRRWLHSSNQKEQWSLRIYSGSQKFIEWLKENTQRLFGIQGRIHQGANNLWILKFGKMAAQVLTKKCYYSGCFGLQRKIDLVNLCQSSRRGWMKSKTISYVNHN